MTCKAINCSNSKNYSWQDYCSYHERCLSKLREYKNIPNIQEIETFETWFNGNCGWVINYDSSFHPYNYRIWIVVYEPKKWNKEIPENLSVIDYSNGRGSPSSARDKVQELKHKLKYSDNPILYVHSLANSYYSFSNVVTSPYVETSTNIPFYNRTYTSIESLNKHFKPLDVAWVLCEGYFHVGVYLSEDKICHFSGENNKVEMTDWFGFIKSFLTTGIVIRHHPIIPFKNYKDIIRQAVWAKDSNFRKGNYNLQNRNCEHFANMLVYGIDFSQQVHENKNILKTKATAQVAGTSLLGGAIGGTSIALAPFTFGLSLIPGAVGTVAACAGANEIARKHDTFNNNKTSICLEREIRDTPLREKSDWETKKYENQYLQEVPAKEHCRII